MTLIDEIYLIGIPVTLAFETWETCYPTPRLKKAQARIVALKNEAWLKKWTPYMLVVSAFLWPIGLLVRVYEMFQK